MKTRTMLLSLSLTLLFGGFAVSDDEEGFKQIWDGKTFKGWKASENKEAWKIEDGKLLCDGKRSHLFYMGDDKPFKNFELRVDVMTTPGSNAGIYFHTKYQETGWPKQGFETQVNNSHRDPKRTGSLYGVENVMKAPAKDNEWYTQSILVKGKRIILSVNGKVLVDYTEPDDVKAGKDFSRVLNEGTFALQAHDPQSKVYFKNIRVKRLD